MRMKWLVSVVARLLTRGRGNGQLIKADEPIIKYYNFMLAEVLDSSWKLAQGILLLAQKSKFDSREKTGKVLRITFQKIQDLIFLK